MRLLSGSQGWVTSRTSAPADREPRDWRRRRIALYVTVAALGLAGCGSQASEVTSAGGSKIHDPVAVDDQVVAPAVEGVDPITGERHRLADFVGRPVVLNFWASWCGPCKQELPDLQRFADANPDIAVLGVNMGDSRGEARALQRELGFTFPSVEDPGNALAPAFDVQAMPITFFLDESHRIRARVAGATDVEGFGSGVELATRRAS